MQDWTERFRQQLQTSADSFAWAASQIPNRLLDQTPVEPEYLGMWQPLRHVWHVSEYERCLALTAMQQWLGVPQPPDDAWQDGDADWAAVPDKNLAALLNDFWQGRRQQIDLIDQLAGVDWETPRVTGWGLRSLAWVVTKTLQHTYEHGDTLLRMGLWWEHILGEIARARAAQETSS